MDAIQAGVETTIHVVDRARQCEEGTVRQPSLKHSKRPRQEGSNRRPGEGELRSQPGREDHQAYRYSKGSEAT